MSQKTRGKKAAAQRPAAVSVANLPPLGEPYAISHDSRPWIARHAALISVLAVMAFLAVIRLRVADVPLERDEGEYAYSGQLILEGIPPFQLAYNMKFPGTYYAYSAILAVFGQTAWGIHVGLLVLNAATILIVFFLARRLLRDPMGGAIAAIAYGFLSLDRWSLAIFGHATHFVVAAALAGLLVLFHAIDSKKLAWFAAAGALLGVSILMKQNGIFFLALGVGIAAWSAFDDIDRRFSRAVVRSGLVAAGAAVSVAILFGVLYSQGVFEKFWFWTIQYASEYASEVSPSDAMDNLRLGLESITQANLSIWLVAILGVILLWVAPWSRRARAHLSLLFLVSVAAVCPGFYFRQHYFILLFPALSVFCGVAVISLQRLLARAAPAPLARAAAVGVFVLAVSIYAQMEWDYFFSITTRRLSRSIYSANPFVESTEIARYIESHTEPDDRIAVLGSEPQIYFHAKRKSATGYIYMYALVEKQKYAAHMQDELIAEITAAHPKYIVYVGVGPSWMARNNTEKVIRWSQAYVKKCYRIVGIVDILSVDETAWAWDDAVASYRPKSQSVLFVMNRNSEEPCAVEIPPAAEK